MKNEFEKQKFFNKLIENLIQMYKLCSLNAILINFLFNLDFVNVDVPKT